MIVDQQPSYKSSGSSTSFRAPDGLAREAATSAAVSQDAESAKVALSWLEAQKIGTVDHQSKLLVDLVAVDDDHES